MKLPVSRVLAVLISSTLASQAQADVAIDVIGGYEVSFSGLVQADGNWFNNDVVDLNGSSGINGKDSEFELRRAELVLSGKGTLFDWVMGYDAKADKWLDVNLKWKRGSSYLMVGQFKQPNSMEELSSTKNNDFISKAMTTNTFGLSRRVGVAYGADNAQWGYSVSAFGREMTRGLAKGQGVGGRVYYAPFVESGRFLHLGASLLDYDTSNDTQRWRIRPDADLATQRLLDTGNITNADRIRTAGLEAAWVNGPIKLQAEYMRSKTSRTNESAGADFDADSWYVSGLWNLTGETWGYKGGTPTTKGADDPASGMWQLGLRVDGANLNDGAIKGGQGTNLTLGVNWYWRSNAKFMLNYVAVQSSKFSASAGEDIDDNPGILEARAQFYW
ncbi:MAG: porin [Dokdonella sp.]|jgi:phosphate-selective porin OprO and OprP|uniref:OprO/OprP family phosphate-selective porin n=1 Tax=Dokdonella sp. TaxID=2291710 RepID=UPI001B440482|nr:porin [Dokdonella sp.]MBK8122410.1 porin [Dokdonella sp.]MBP6326484.1 porin [Dokdonella sp.]MBP6328568.1 porin [Dokdonella sp.]HNV06895.1 porin [Dokdonella sp.]HPW03265.1 porin [Dokdonella sp.]